MLEPHSNYIRMSFASTKNGLDLLFMNLLTEFLHSDFMNFIESFWRDLEFCFLRFMIEIEAEFVFLKQKFDFVVEQEILLQS